MKNKISSFDIVKNIIKNKIYLSVLVFSLLALFMLPLVGQKVIVPVFYNQMMLNILDEAKRVGKHISRHQDYEQKSAVLHLALDKLKDDFKIVKIKLFDKNGYITFSTDPQDIGTKNQHDYFYTIVAKGEMLHKISTKGTKSLEGKEVPRDVAEIYVPMMKDDIFIGASEIYYDITEKRESFLKLMDKVGIIYSLISLTFLFFIVFMLFSASRTNLKEIQKEKELESLNDSLKDQVNEQTKELQQINANLEERIKLEIDKNREKDNKLFQQSKLASMGEMMGNIAHQWRQPLSAISSTTTSVMLQKELGLLSEEELKDSFEKILKSTQYLSNTIEDFRNFFKTDKQKTTVKLSDLLHVTLSILESTLANKNIKVITHIQDVSLFTLSSELQQAILNIINNAVDALDDSKNNHLKNKYILVSGYKIDDNVMIQIKDNAQGIPQNILDKIFEPYFTTKHQSQGTGIGLFMTQEIIEKHLYGTIKVSNESFEFETEKYIGAQFEIVLPGDKKDGNL